jgi:hypothetical protein
MLGWFLHSKKRPSKKPDRLRPPRASKLASTRFRPLLEPLEDRQLLAVATYLATGADAGGGPVVNVYSRFGTLLFSFFAYNPSFTGGVRVAVGDVNGDGIPDIITAPGPGGTPDIRVFDGAHLNLANPFGGDMIREFLAYSPLFPGGVYVAAGNVEHNGFFDIITGAGAGGGPHVEVWSGRTGALIASFYAYSKFFPGGVRVASGDVSNNGFWDIITGAGPGGGPQVNVYSGFNGQLLAAFYAYNKNFTGGVFVGSGDVNRDGFWDIITGAGKGGGPFVQVFSGFNGVVIASFNAFNPAFTGGVTVASADINADGFYDVIVGAGPGGGPEVKVISGFDGTVLLDFNAYSPFFSGGVFVGGA